MVAAKCRCSGNLEMGLQKRLEAEGDLLSYNLRKEPTATRKTPQAVDLHEDSDPLRTARGVFMGVIVGSILWATILWVVL